MTRTLMMLMVGLSCKSTVDPNKGFFACEQEDDCGSGYTCIKQAKGGGLCFPKGQCLNVDPCNAKDDDCDGVVDNFVREDGAYCETPMKGACLAGKTRCIAGALACIESVAPVPETCNGLDDDCDGLVDEDFMLSSSPSNCGRCGRQCGGGTSCNVGECVESVCGDSVDNDSNGLVDCLDPACGEKTCFPGATPAYKCNVLDGGVDGGLAGEADAGSGASDGGPGINCVAVP
jgi:hypothetical protein